MPARQATGVRDGAGGIGRDEGDEGGEGGEGDEGVEGNEPRHALQSERWLHGGGGHRPQWALRSVLW